MSTSCWILASLTLLAASRGSASPGNQYLYSYETTFKLDNGQRSRTGAKQAAFDYRATVGISRIWSTNEESLFKFEISEENLYATWDGRDPINESVPLGPDPLTFPSSMSRTFIARFHQCQPKALFSVPGESDSSLNLYRGILAIFQYHDADWEGVEVGVSGQLTAARYKVDHRSLWVEKVPCSHLGLQDRANPVLANCTSPEPFKLLGATTDHRIRGQYSFLLSSAPDSPPFCSTNGGGREVLDLAERVEEYNSNLNVVSSLRTVVKSKQILQLKGQVDTEIELTSEDLNKALEDVNSKLKNAGGIGLEEHGLQMEIKEDLWKASGDPQFKASTPARAKSNLKKNKESLSSKSLSSLRAVKAFLQLRQDVNSGALRPEELELLLKDKAKADVWCQVMDVVGSSNSTEVHEVAFKTICSSEGSKSFNHGACERFLWALSHAQTPPPEQTAKRLEEYVKNRRFPTKAIGMTASLALASMYSRVKNAKARDSIKVWIINAFLSASDKNMKELKFLSLALMNTDDLELAFLILKNSMEDTSVNSRREAASAAVMTSIASMTSFGHLVNVCPRDIFSKVWQGPMSKHLDQVLLDWALEDSKEGVMAMSLRSLAIQVLLHIQPSLESVKTFLREIKSVKGGDVLLRSFLLKLIQVSNFDEHINTIKRSLQQEGLINWANLATGGFSVNLVQPLFPTPDGNFSFFFDLEMSGSILKRSNFEIFFMPSLGKVDAQFVRLFQLDTFAGGLSSYFGGDNEGPEGNQPENGDETEPFAGMQPGILGKSLRPFTLFSSTAELMQLYWSGSLDQKTSALSGNLMVQDHSRVVHFANGVSMLVDISGAVSFDAAGQGSVSLWDKSAFAKVENSAAYILTSKEVVNFLKPTAFLEQIGTMSTKAHFNMDTNISLGDDALMMCLIANRPDGKIIYERTLTGTVGSSKGTPRKRFVRKVALPGVTNNLSNGLNSLCNQMFPRKVVGAKYGQHH